VACTTRLNSVVAERDVCQDSAVLNVGLPPDQDVPVLVRSFAACLASVTEVSITAVRELLWGSIPMVITGYFLSRMMGSPATGNLT
jgi:hypothetical protein